MIFVRIINIRITESLRSSRYVCNWLVQLFRFIPLFNIIIVFCAFFRSSIVFLGTHCLSLCSVKSFVAYAVYTSYKIYCSYKICCIYLYSSWVLWVIINKPSWSCLFWIESRISSLPYLIIRTSKYASFPCSSVSRVNCTCVLKDFKTF